MAIIEGAYALPHSLTSVYPAAGISPPVPLPAAGKIAAGTSKEKCGWDVAQRGRDATPR